MDFSTTLAAQIEQFLDGFDPGGDGLSSSLADMSRDLVHAVPSYLGLTMSFVIEGQLVLLTSTAGQATQAVGATLTMPLSTLIDTDPHSEIELYAATAGAFVDLAADLRYALRLADTVIRLDERLEHVLTASGLSGVEELVMINRAIGLLIGDGYTPATALSQLRSRASAARSSVQAAARLLLFPVRWARGDSTPEAAPPEDGLSAD